MSRPGVEVTSSAAAPPRGAPTDTSVAFVLAEAQMGPTDAPVRVTSLDEFTSTYGARLAGTYGYDALDTAFHSGVTSLYFMRIEDGGTPATADASAIAPGTTADAASAGTWANSLELDVGAAPAMLSAKAQKARPEALTFPEGQAAGDMIAVVKLNGAAVQTSPTVSTVAELAAFLATGDYLTLSGPDGPLTAASVDLAGGTDGVVPVDEVSALQAGLDALSADYGPGQVLAPGRNDSDSHGALLAHCAGTSMAGVNRVALLDSARDDDPTALASRAALLRGSLQDRYGSLWGPWAVIPGLAPGTSRVVPWSAVQAGLCAAVDGAGNPNQAAAGPWGVASYVNDLTQVYSPDDCETLLYAGVNTARIVYGQVEAYAFRTLVDPAGPRAEWREFNHARLNMAIVAQAKAIGERFVFSQLDGRGHTIARFNGQLAGMLAVFYGDDALFGDDATQAFEVNTGPAVNTPESLADGVLAAVLSVRMSPHAELVQIPIVKVPITVALAA
jgi:hypothetical protein